MDGNDWLNPQSLDEACKIKIFIKEQIK